MIPFSFPIAHFPTSVNLLSYVILPTYLIPEDDTPDVIPRHTMLRHAYHVSVTRNFRLTPITPPTPLRDLRPLHLPHPYASPPLCAPHHALARQPSACRLPAPPRSITPPYSYSLVSRETCEDNPRQQREGSTRAWAARSFVAASVVLAALALLRRRRPQDDHGAVASRAAEMIPIGTHLFHVKPRRMIIPARHHFAPRT